jgi:hypothetical protein
MTLPRRVAQSFARAHRRRTFAPPVRLDGFDVVMAFHPRSATEPQIQWLKGVIRAAPARGRA